MKTIVSRRELTKLCYTLANLIDNLELTTESVKYSATSVDFSLFFVGRTDPNNPVILDGKSQGHSFHLSIPVRDTKVYGGGVVDFSELCTIITSLSKEVSLIELEIVGNKITTKTHLRYFNG